MKNDAKKKERIIDTMTTEDKIAAAMDLINPATHVMIKIDQAKRKLEDGDLVGAGLELNPMSSPLVDLIKDVKDVANGENPIVRRMEECRLMADDVGKPSSKQKEAALRREAIRRKQNSR